VGVINRECDSKYICTSCGKVTAGNSKEIEYTMKDRKYIACMHCGKEFEYPYKNYDECMNHSSYVREKGAIKQKR